MADDKKDYVRVHVSPAPKRNKPVPMGGSVAGGPGVSVHEVKAEQGRKAHKAGALVGPTTKIDTVVVRRH